jgi:hypothetical protein
MLDVVIKVGVAVLPEVDPRRTGGGRGSGRRLRARVVVGPPGLAGLVDSVWHATFVLPPPRDDVAADSRDLVARPTSGTRFPRQRAHDARRDAGGWMLIGVAGGPGFDAIFCAARRCRGASEPIGSEEFVTPLDLCRQRPPLVRRLSAAVEARRSPDPCSDRGHRCRRGNVRRGMCWRPHGDGFVITGVATAGAGQGGEAQEAAWRRSPPPRRRPRRERTQRFPPGPDMASMGAAPVAEQMRDHRPREAPGRPPT